MKLLEAIALEAGHCKPGNVCPGKYKDFNYAEIIDDAASLAEACATWTSVDDAYSKGLKSQKKTTLTGFIILVVPLVFCANSKDLKGCIRELLSSGTANTFLDALRSLKISHFKRVEARDYPNFEGKSSSETLLDLFVRLSAYDPVFSEVVNGYPNVAAGTAFLEECGLSGRCLRELQRLFLVNVPDVLIIRKHGFRVYSVVREYASANVHEIYLEEKGINPGTSADFVGTSIYLLLRRRARRQ